MLHRRIMKKKKLHHSYFGNAHDSHSSSDLGRYVLRGASEFQNLTILSTKRFGKMSPEKFDVILGNVPEPDESNSSSCASNEPINLDGEELNNRIGERIKGELRYLDGPVIAASTVLNKTMKNSFTEEKQVTNEPWRVRILFR
ncbi:hypothetical protein JHK82_024219 [Glycine max]|nr:hypothetical protein JHK86_024308 [Glycine max]KAG5133031.1 hypothetical protein JHK82_024219 [Glycine max]